MSTLSLTLHQSGAHYGASKIMKWIAISGTWRKMNKELEKDIRDNVKEIINRGDGIVTGGALNVDFVAVDEALKLNATAKRIKIFLPATLEIFAAHYRKRAKEGVITEEQTENLISQLSRIKEINFSSLIENKDNKVINEEAYHKRNTTIINAADELIAFRVKEKVGGTGVKDTIEKARKKGIPVKVFTYTIE